MYDVDGQDSDCESAEGADHGATRGEYEEEEEKKEVIMTTGNAPATQQQMYGALPFKPKLAEYLIDSSEEGMNDTLFYVKHARRLAMTEHTN